MEYITLRDIADISSNLVTSKNINIKDPVEIKELKIGMIKSRTLIEETENLTEQPSNKRENNELAKGDIIIKRVSPLFATYIEDPKEMWLGPNLTRIRIKEEYKDQYISSFIACYIDSKIKEIIREEAKLPLLKLDNLKELQIPKIDIDKQKTIGKAWLYNSKQLDIDTELINAEFEYNKNLILGKLEALNG